MRPTAQLIYHIYKSLSFAHKINTILMVHSCPFNLAPAIQCRNTVYFIRPDNQRSERRLLQLLILGIVAQSVGVRDCQVVASGRSSRCALPDPVTEGATTASDDDHGASELK